MQSSNLNSTLSKTNKKEKEPSTPKTTLPVSLKVQLYRQGSTGEPWTQTWIWHPKQPLPLTHPVQWILESQGSTVQARKIAAISRKASPVKRLTIPIQRWGEPASTTVLDSELRISVTETLPWKNLWDEKTTATIGANPTLLLFHSQNGLPSETCSFQDQWKERQAGQLFFELKLNNKKIKISSFHDPLVLIHGGASTALPRGQTIDCDLEHEQPVLQAGNHRWALRLTTSVEAIPELPIEPVDPNAKLFRQSLLASLGGIAVFWAVSWFFSSSSTQAPSNGEEELIPAQVAKLILSKPKPQAPSAASTSAATSNRAIDQNPSIRNSKNNVVRSFESKALQRAVSGLLKGGMTKFLVDAGQLQIGQVSKTLGQPSQVGAQATRDLASLGNAAPGVAVEQTGGSAEKTSGVGYQNGKSAKIQGQGQALVSLDLDQSTIEEGLSKDEVGKVIHSHLSEIRYCYEASMIRNPDLEGKLIIDFAINGKGSVDTASIKSSTLADPRLDDCILRRLTKWAFPKPKGGVTVGVSYPFLFKSLGK